jgi:hypothetical protein
MSEMIIVRAAVLKDQFKKKYGAVGAGRQELFRFPAG